MQDVLYVATCQDALQESLLHICSCSIKLPYSIGKDTWHEKTRLVQRRRHTVV